MQVIGSLVLLMFIVVLLFVILKLNGFDLTSPASIVCCMTLFSMLVMVFFSKKYGIDLSLQCVVLVTLAVLSFSFAELVKPSRLVRVSLLEDVEIYSTRIVVFAFSFVAVSTFLYYKEVRNIAGMMGFSSNSANGMLYYYRTATLQGGDEIASQSKFVGQLTIASFAVAYIMIVDFVKRIIYCKIRAHIIVFLIEGSTLIAFLIQCVLSGGRTQFLYYIESFVFLLVFFICKKTGYRISIKGVRWLIIVLCVTVVAFYFLGTFTGKTAKFNFVETLFVYIGAPIEAFNKLLDNAVLFTSLYFGSNVFIGPIDLFNRFGANIKMQDLVAPFVNIGEIKTNIYGSFGRYYADFGLIGLVLVNILIGMIFHSMYIQLQRNNFKIERRLTIYLVLSKVLYDYCIEERFFTSILSLGTILRIIYIIIFLKIFSTRITFGRRNMK